MNPTDPTPAPATGPTASIVVHVDGLIDTWIANRNEIELHLTPTGSDIETIVVVPLETARAWAADIWAAVSVAYQEHVGDPHTLTRFEADVLPAEAQVIVDYLAQRWHPTRPVELPGDVVVPSSSGPPS